jgi:hypothetical protein
MSQLTINCHVTLIVLRTNHYFTATNVTDEFEEALSNCHSPQIRENGQLLVRMCRGMSHFCQKWPLANVVEFGEYHKWPHFGECEFGEYSKCFWRVWRI